MNAPDRFELFILPDGQEKLVIQPDLKTPNSVLIKIEKEDHTLGNLLVSQLLKDPQVIFAAYKIPHPLFATFNIRLQVEDDYDCKTALKKACGLLISELDMIKEKFKDEWKLKSLLQE
jgi:DNA-directed RNA polymerase II subunit RPB11